MLSALAMGMSGVVIVSVVLNVVMALGCVGVMDSECGDVWRVNVVVVVVSVMMMQRECVVGYGGCLICVVVNVVTVSMVMLESGSW